jgi:hypothetical protein
VWTATPPRRNRVILQVLSKRLAEGAGVHELEYKLNIEVTVTADRMKDCLVYWMTVFACMSLCPHKDGQAHMEPDYGACCYVILRQS